MLTPLTNAREPDAGGVCRCQDGMNEETAGILLVFLRLLTSVADGCTPSNLELLSLAQRIARARRLPDGETT